MYQRQIARLTVAVGVDRLHNNTSLILSGDLIHSHDAETLGVLSEVTPLGSVRGKVPKRVLLGPSFLLSFVYLDETLFVLVILATNISTELLLFSLVFNVNLTALVVRDLVIRSVNEHITLVGVVNLGKVQAAFGLVL